MAYPKSSPFGTNNKPEKYKYQLAACAKLQTTVNEDIPKNTPIDNSIMNGRRRPRFKRHRSLTEPSMGVRKNPISGDRAHTSVMFWCLTPMRKRVGETNAVSAAYENSIPITAADTRTSSIRLLGLD